jgi:hypothetical protein
MKTGKIGEMSLFCQLLIFLTLKTSNGNQTLISDKSFKMIYNIKVDFFEEE